VTSVFRALCTNLLTYLLTFIYSRNTVLVKQKIVIIIIIIERKDLGGVMSKDCKDTLQTLKTVTKRECDAK